MNNLFLKGKYFELYQLQTRSGSNCGPLKKGDR